jgi:hypothetical protein
MPPDYSSQLDAIAKALNHPTTPTWLIAIFSAFLGFLASTMGQLFQHWYGDLRSRKKMRIIIYSELGSMYSALSHFYTVKTELSELEDIEWRKRQLKERFLKFDGEKYADDNKDVFIQLKERSTIRELYDAIREVFGPEEDYGFFINAGLAIEIIEDCVRLNGLPERFVKHYMNTTDIQNLDSANERRLALGQAKARKQ